MRKTTKRIAITPDTWDKLKVYKAQKKFPDFDSMLRKVVLKIS